MNVESANTIQTAKMLAQEGQFDFAVRILISQQDQDPNNPELEKTIKEIFESRALRHDLQAAQLQQEILQGRVRPMQQMVPVGMPPGMMQPGMAQFGIPPGMAQFGIPPGMVQPGMVQPGMVQMAPPLKPIGRQPAEPVRMPPMQLPGVPARAPQMIAVPPQNLAAMRQVVPEPAAARADGAFGLLSLEKPQAPAPKVPIAPPPQIKRKGPAKNRPQPALTPGFTVAIETYWHAKLDDQEMLHNRSINAGKKEVTEANAMLRQLQGLAPAGRKRKSAAAAAADASDAQATKKQAPTQKAIELDSSSDGE